MSFEEIASLLNDAKRPIDVFGYIDEEEIKKKYKSLVKKCHPDIVKDKYKSIAADVTALLNKYYELALEEIKKGIYNVDDEKKILKSKDVLFEFTLKGKTYKFYKYFESEDVCDVYEGIVDDNLVLLKVVVDENDNELLINEFNTLNSLNHFSILKPISKVKINDKIALIFNKPNALTIKELKEEYGNINPSHVCWMMERLLSAVGYLHSNKIVHGNIKEENILIDIDNHNVIIKDFSLCVTNANEVDSKYKIINEDYTPSYVSSNSKVIPNADIYAVGKIAINLMGGDIKRVALPVNCDIRIRNFIRKLLSTSENDAWKLWNELIEIRKEVYGPKKFQTLTKKKK